MRTDSMGRQQPAKKPKKKKAEPTESDEPSTEDAVQINMAEKPVEKRTVSHVLNDFADLYVELPRDPEDAANQAMARGWWMSDQRTDHIAWWFHTYAEAARQRA